MKKIFIICLVLATVSIFAQEGPDSEVVSTESTDTEAVIVTEAELDMDEIEFMVLFEPNGYGGYVKGDDPWVNIFTLPGLTQPVESASTQATTGLVLTLGGVGTMVGGSLFMISRALDKSNREPIFGTVATIEGIGLAMLITGFIVGFGSVDVYNEYAEEYNAGLIPSD
jgi:hypothetical protein